jgi:hypothetical protein
MLAFGYGNQAGQHCEQDETPNHFPTASDWIHDKLLANSDGWSGCVTKFEASPHML